MMRFTIHQQHGVWQIVPPTFPPMERSEWLILIAALAKVKENPSAIKAAVQKLYPDAEFEVKHNDK